MSFRVLNIYVFFLAVLFAALIGWKQYLLLNGFYFHDFDLAIFTQGVWKLSRFETPFVTIRGLHLFADHFSIINFVFVPFFWIWPSPLVLLWGQTLILTASGIIFYRICRRLLQSQILIAIMVTFYFCYPPLLQLSLRQYHENCFSVLFAMIFLWALEKRNTWGVIGSTLGLILTKESKPLLAAGLSFYGWLRFRWKPGLYLSAFSLLCFGLILFVLMPLFISPGQEYPYANRTLWQLKDFLKGQLPLMSFLNGTLLLKDNMSYLLGLFVPFLFLSWISPGAFLLNPIFWINLFSSWSYSHSIEYHYTAGIIATLAYSATLGLAKIERRWTYPQRTWGKISLFLSCFLFVAINLQWAGPAALRGQAIFKAEPERKQSFLDDIQEIKSLYPQEALSAHYTLMAHFATQELIYMWPNPYKNSNYGFSTTDTPEKKPHYLIWPHGVEFNPKEIVIFHEFGFVLERSLSKLDIYSRK